MPTIEPSDSFALGERRVLRMGYGAMRLAGPGVSDLRKIAKLRSPCFRKLLRPESATSTQATFMALTWSTA